MKDATLSGPGASPAGSVPCPNHLQKGFQRGIDQRCAATLSSRCARTIGPAPGYEIASIRAPLTTHLPLSFTTRYISMDELRLPSQ